MRQLKVNLIALCGIALCGLLLAGSATPTDAQTPEPHPGYLHAISDLRQARSLLQTHFVSPEHAKVAASALPQIDDAIGDLKFATKLDDKHLGDVPPYSDMPPAQRFHKVQDLLGQAHKDASGTESDQAAVKARDSGLKHIDAAMAAITHAL